MVTAVVRVQTVVVSVEVVFPHHRPLQPAHHTVGRSEDVPGGDEDPATPHVVICELEDDRPGPLPRHSLLAPQYQTVEGVPLPTGVSLRVLGAAHFTFLPMKAAVVLSEVGPDLKASVIC